jgi:hypothetical protein
MLSQVTFHKNSRLHLICLVAAGSDDSYLLAMCRAYFLVGYSCSQRCSIQQVESQSDLGFLQEHIERLKATDLLALVIKLSEAVPGVTEKIVQELDEARAQPKFVERELLDGEPDLQFLNNLLLGTDLSADNDLPRVAQQAETLSPTCVAEAASNTPQPSPAGLKLSTTAPEFTPGQ